MTPDFASALAGLPPSPWHWESDKLLAADGTVILWAVVDCCGTKYIGVQADCDDFIADAPGLIEQLMAENANLKRAISECEEYAHDKGISL